MSELRLCLCKLVTHVCKGVGFNQLVKGLSTKTLRSRHMWASEHACSRQLQVHQQVQHVLDDGEIYGFHKKWPQNRLQYTQILAIRIPFFETWVSHQLGALKPAFTTPCPGAATPAAAATQGHLFPLRMLVGFRYLGLYRGHGKENGNCNIGV